MKQGIYYNLENNDYHKDDGYISSSALKLLLEDPIRYKAKYVDKTIKTEHKDVFDIGNAFHTKFLEPHKFDSEYTKFEGTKRGKKWDEFKALNEGKIILGNKGWLEYENLIRSTKMHKDHERLLEGKSEVSFYTILDGIKVKVRFDKINFENGFGMDLKSTTGLLLGSKGTYKIKQSIAGLDYDLSAALYLDAANKIIKQINNKMELSPTQNVKQKIEPIKEWYWIFSSKDYASCKICMASETMLQNGRKKYKLAIELLKKYEASNWEAQELKESIETIDPLDSDLIIDSGKTEGVKTW